MSDQTPSAAATGAETWELAGWDHAARIDWEKGLLVLLISHQINDYRFVL